MLMHALSLPHLEKSHRQKKTTFGEWCTIVKSSLNIDRDRKMIY